MRILNNAIGSVRAGELRDGDPASATEAAALTAGADACVFITRAFRRG